MKRYTISELETMTQTHTLLPDGSVRRKKYRVKKISKEKKFKASKTDTCICMDCGEIIKISKQSSHLKSCKKAGNQNYAPKR